MPGESLNHLFALAQSTGQVHHAHDLRFLVERIADKIGTVAADLGSVRTRSDEDDSRGAAGAAAEQGGLRLRLAARRSAQRPHLRRHPPRATEIAKRLGVSITPVREALRRLENDRLIRYEQNHGATVIDLSADALVEYCNVRAVVEGLGARLAASRVTAEELDRPRAIHERMVADEKAGRYETLGEQSRDFHMGHHRHRRRGVPGRPRTGGA